MDEAAAFLGAADVRTVRVSDGVWHHALVGEAGPWSVHVAEIDLTRCDLGFRVLTAESVTGTRRSFARTSSMADVAGALVAVNGDFYMAEGLPTGPEVTGGEVRRLPDRPAFAWAPGAELAIGNIARGDEGEVVVDGDALDLDRGVEAIGGRPVLVDGGRGVEAEGFTDDFRLRRHPRTGIAIDRTRSRMWLVVVDGRQDHSVGMTLPEFRRFMQLLGAHEALNLDGGGSTTMIAGGLLVNRPSDSAGERAVVNGLGLVRDPALCWAGRARAD